MSSRQWGSQADQYPSNASSKSVYTADGDGRLHMLSEKKPKSARSTDLSKMVKKTASVIAAQATAETIPTVDAALTWPVHLICNICKAKFGKTTELYDHLNDPAGHDNVKFLGARARTAQLPEKERECGPVAAQGKKTGVSRWPLQLLPRVPASSHRRDPRAMPTRKRSWDEYADRKIQQPLSTPPLSETRRYEESKTEPDVISISSSDESSSPKATSPIVSHQSKNILSASWYPQIHQQEHSQLTSHSLDVDRSAMGSFSPPETQDIPNTGPPLCLEQRRLVETIMSGRNVFYTGSAGCGKSTVLKNFVSRLKEQMVTRYDENGKARREPKQIDIIAPTGRAALDINGSTFWTYAGWNPDSMRKPLEKLQDAAAHGKWVRRRLRATDVLVIDEISMVENHHLERLNHIMQAARGNLQAFGGVQVVVTGDFWPLSKIQSEHPTSGLPTLTSTCPSGHGTWPDSAKWAFCASAWSAADFAHVNLTTIHRQSDRTFIDVLQKCRLGVPFTREEEDLLLTHDSQTGNAVRLFSTRAEVAAVNREAFERLKTRERVYGCYDDFRCWNPILERRARRSDGVTLDALKDHRFETRIALKQGMVVVLLVNLDQSLGLVNGSQGVVMGFERVEDSRLPEAVKKDSKGEYDYSRMGMGPVLTGEHAEVREGNIRSFVEAQGNKEWPVVLFQNKVKRTIYADCRVTEVGDEAPYSLISRTQVPLVAGWAMTVHKSQGMTLNRVVVNLSKSFEEGQMYVALSRARSLEGLKVEGLGKQQGCNERVRQFLREMLRIDGA